MSAKHPNNTIARNVTYYVYALAIAMKFNLI